MLRRDCVDAAFGQFLTLTEWVCCQRGVFFMRVNPNGTSQTCPKCLVRVQKNLGVRVHCCPECKYETHRDHAAAEMVLIRGYETVVLRDSEESLIARWESVYRGRKSRARGVDPGMLNREEGCASAIPVRVGVWRLLQKAVS